MRTLLVLAMVVVALVAGAAPAGAHASLRNSDPATGAELARSPKSVSLTFTEQPDLALSSLRVLDVRGRSFEKEKPRSIAGDPFTVRVETELLEKGVYFVLWRVVSKFDGHSTGGTVSFGVGVDPRDVTPPDFELLAQAEVPPLGVVGRFLFLVGVVALLGAAWVSAALFQEPVPTTRRLMEASLVTAFAGLVFLAGAQRSTAQVSLLALAPTFLGKALIGRAGFLLLAAIAVFRTNGSARARRLAAIVAGLAAVGAVVVHVAAGHGGATTAREWLKFTAQSTHFAAAGVWLGGLGALLLGIRGAPGAERAAAVRRFSKVAGLALAVVVVSGALRAINMVGSWDNLFSTTYGRVVVTKVALFSGLVGLAAVNRYRNVLRAAREVRSLRRVSSGELVLGIAILGATALLTNLQPPAGFSAREEPPIEATGSDFATTMKVRLEVTRVDSRTHNFEVTASDFDTGEPVDARRVSLRFEFVAVGGAEEAPVELLRRRGGRYGARAQDLAIDGRMRIILLIQRATDSAEVVLRVKVPCRAEAIEAEGGPPLYDIPLAKGSSAEAYVDPGKTGLNDVYINFKAGGGELPVSQVNIFASSEGDRLVRLEARRMSVGKFVSETRLSSGNWRFDFEAASALGEPLRGCFEQRVRA